MTREGFSKTPTMNCLKHSTDAVYVYVPESATPWILDPDCVEGVAQLSARDHSADYLTHSPVDR